MKYLFTVILTFAFGLACKQKVLSGAELENRLIKTMQDYLNKTAKPGVTYAVKDVTFFADQKKKQYNCEFRVNMHVDKIDTTGIMTANIPNDFSSVERKQ
ncbi:MAG: hypothetical protein E6H06_00420 [Bacteroidetes bacterium]|nr:MAG: hypothetical protein E6H06_00420 [Bacteroidota bacterium]